MSERAPELSPENYAKLHELMLSIGKPGVAVYIDVYPVDPANPYDYTYEYWETRLDGACGTEEFRNGTE